MNTFQVTKKHVGQQCRFDSYDDAQHFGVIESVRNGIITVTYRMRGFTESGLFTAYVPKSEHRVTVL